MRCKITFETADACLQSAWMLRAKQTSRVAANEINDGLINVCKYFILTVSLGIGSRYSRKLTNALGPAKPRRTLANVAQMTRSSVHWCKPAQLPAAKSLSCCVRREEKTHKREISFEIPITNVDRKDLVEWQVWKLNEYAITSDIIFVSLACHAFM